MNYIKSPINYTGNKFRILPQIMPHFPDNIDTMVDLFCGGATVGCNTNAKNVIFIDSNERVIELLEFISKSEFNQLYTELNKIIDRYNLSKSAENTYGYYYSLAEPNNKNNGLKEYNKKGFYELRSDYNSLSNKSSAKAQKMLYVLLVYGFNNDLRFNSKGEYNLPIGKTDLNKNNISKVREFIKRSKEQSFTFVCGDFRDSIIKDKIVSANFVYADPPYLITNAVYNENNGWNEEKERALLDVYSELLTGEVDFAFSNVLNKTNQTNKLLENWISEHKNAVEVINIAYHYRSSSYNKKNRQANEAEILVKKDV